MHNPTIERCWHRLLVRLHLRHEFWTPPGLYASDPEADEVERYREAGFFVQKLECWTPVWLS